MSLTVDARGLFQVSIIEVVLLQVRVLSVKDGKIDVTQQTAAEAKLDAELSKGVGTVKVGDDASPFAFMLARAGVQRSDFGSNVGVLSAPASASYNGLETIFAGMQATLVVRTYSMPFPTSSATVVLQVTFSHPLPKPSKATIEDLFQGCVTTVDATAYVFLFTGYRQ
jgi:hypothetical protein